MDIIVKEIEPCKLNITCTMDAGHILNKRAEVLKAFQKAPVKGFRPNKAPLDIIKHQYKDQIEESLKRALAEDAFQEAVFEKKLRPHGTPHFNSLLMLDGKFVCDFSLMTKPDFELMDFRTLEVPKPYTSLNVENLTEEMIQDLRMKLGQVDAFSDTDLAMDGDNVIVDYQGFINGEKIEGLSGSAEMMTVGKCPVPEFDQQLRGMMIGDAKEFDLLAPPTSLPSIAGKMIHFTLSLSMGSRTIPHALNDELAQKAGHADFNALRAFAHGTASARVELDQKKKNSEAVGSHLLQGTTVEVPNFFALSEAQYLAQQAKLDWNTMKEEDQQRYLEMGRQNVKLALILDKVREVEPEAQLADQEVFEILKQNLMKTQIKTSLDDVMKEMQRTGYLQIFFARIKDEYAMDFVCKHVKFVE